MLDIRMLTNNQVAILDGSLSLHYHEKQSTTPPNPSSTAASHESLSLLQPIPSMSQLVETVIKTLSHDKTLRATLVDQARKVVMINLRNGIKCSESVAPIVLRALHENLLEKLRISA
jgi:hypothetical protein